MADRVGKYHANVLLPGIKKTIEQEKQDRKLQEERSYQHLKNLNQQAQIKKTLLKMNNDKLLDQIKEGEVRRKQDWLMRYGN